jgi:hypothetical protein
MAEEQTPDSQRLAVLCTVDDLKTDGFVLRRDIPRSERVRRAGKMMGIFFLAAFFTLFVPILHFILPPLFLIVGGILSWSTWMETAEILTGEIVCPNCKKVMTLGRSSEDWPKDHRCEGCSYSLKVLPR